MPAVGDEERRREEPDRHQADAVGRGELAGDGAGVGDVPTRGEAERAPAGDCPLDRAHGPLRVYALTPRVSARIGAMGPSDAATTRS